MAHERDLFIARLADESLRYYLLGVVLALVLGGLIALAFWLIAPDLLLHPAASTTQAAYAHLTPGPVTFLSSFSQKQSPRWEKKSSSEVF